jgi:hypothetical protein
MFDTCPPPLSLSLCARHVMLVLMWPPGRLYINDPGFSISRCVPLTEGGSGGGVCVGLRECVCVYV